MCKLRKIQSFIDRALDLSKGDSYLESVVDSWIPLIEKILLAPPTTKKTTIALIKTIIKYLFFHFEAYLLKSKSAKHEVLIWPAQHNHLDNLIPLSEKLSEANISHTFLVVRQDLIKRLNIKGIPVIEYSFRRYFNPNINFFKNLFKLSKLLTAVLISREISSKPKMVISLFEAAMLSRKYKSLYALVHNKFKPKYNLVGYEQSTICRPIVFYSNYDGIPTGSVQHGTINHILAKYSKVDQLFFWDSLSLNHFTDQKAPKKLFLTGSPAKFREKELVKKHKVTNYLPDSYILICFSGPGHNVSKTGHIECLKILNRLIAQLINQKFVIKLHPKDSPLYYHTISKRKNVILIEKTDKRFNLPIDSFLAKAICILTGASTVALEALFKGKPVISLDVLGELDHIKFLKHPAISKTSSLNTLREALLNILNKSETYVEKRRVVEEIAQEYEYLHSNDPSIRILEVIKEVIK